MSSLIWLVDDRFASSRLRVGTFGGSETSDCCLIGIHHASFCHMPLRLVESLAILLSVGGVGHRYL